jgi:thiosulfate/3-mercaptopyruvate sulfurtransferase
MFLSMEDDMKRDSLLVEGDELKTKIDNPNIRIFDATILFYLGLSPEEIAKMPTAHEQYLAGHIPGAAFFDHSKFYDADSPYEFMLATDEQLAYQIGETGIANDSEVIVYTTGILACATRAWWLLRYAGLENVRVLNGGLAAWKEAGGAVEQGEHRYAPARFEGQFKPEMFASKEEVQAAMNQDGVYTENALDQEWHDQEHIPGSTCLPLMDLMVNWDAFLPEDQLAERLKKADQDQRIITYCGGGIAATVNAMAYLMAGNKNVGVYDGSLYEWKGEGLPVAGKE